MFYILIVSKKKHWLEFEDEMERDACYEVIVKNFPNDKVYKL